MSNDATAGEILARVRLVTAGVRELVGNKADLRKLIRGH